MFSLDKRECGDGIAISTGVLRLLLASLKYLVAGLAGAAVTLGVMRLMGG